MEGLPDPGQIWSDFTSNPVVQLAATLIVVYVVMLWLGTAYWAFRDMQARTEPDPALFRVGSSSSSPRSCSCSRG